MTQEEKQLLAKDIFGRVLTGLKVDYHGETFTLGYNLYLEDGDIAFESYPMKFYLEGIETIKPYLRPMSSMTQEEIDEYDAELDKDLDITMDGALDKDRHITSDGKHNFSKNFVAHFGNDWLNAHHFDYRGLIEKGLALEAPEGMYEI